MNITGKLAVAAVGLALVTPVFGADYPTLKNGQWELTATRAAAGDATPRVSQLCLDAATQKAMIEMGTGMQKSMCTKMDMRREGSRYVSEAECRFGESVMRSHGVMTMSGDTAYHTESTATFDPPVMKDVRETKTVIDGKYTGPCRDGMVPGDVMTPTGQKINLKALQERAAAKGK